MICMLTPSTLLIELRPIIFGFDIPLSVLLFSLQRVLFISMMMTTKVKSSRRHRHTRSYTLELTLYESLFILPPFLLLIVAFSLLFFHVAACCSLYFFFLVSFLFLLIFECQLEFLISFSLIRLTLHITWQRCEHTKLPCLVLAHPSISCLICLMQKYFDHINFIVS